MRTSRLLLAALLALPLLTAAAVPSSAQEAGPPPVQVGDADSGRTVRLVPGQELQVELVAPSTGEQWQGPASTGPLFLTEYAERADRTTATLEALSVTADPVVLRARTDRSCFHSIAACPQGFSEWSLSVVVDDGPAASPAYECFSMPMVSAAPGTTPIDETANGTRITIEEGDAVYLQLRGCSDPWVVPTADGPLFREKADYRALGVNATLFRALSQGTSTITSSTDAVCFHASPPCARPSQQFTVEVQVVAATCDQPAPTLALDRSTIRATESARVTLRGTPGAAVELWAYTRPSTTYRMVRSGIVGNDGTLGFDVRPPANTRLQARERDCAFGPSVVLNVRTALTLGVERLGAREYAFSGDSLPARPGGLVVSVYRITTDGAQVLTAQARASESTGEWRLVRRFSGSGRFGFLARTGQDLLNAPGSSAVRSLLVY